MPFIPPAADCFPLPGGLFLIVAFLPPQGKTEKMIIIFTNNKTQ